MPLVQNGLGELSSSQHSPSPLSLPRTLTRSRCVLLSCLRCSYQPPRVGEQAVEPGVDHTARRLLPQH